MTELTKDQAREESLRLWHALPPDQRQTLDQAGLFAEVLAEKLAFRTMGNSRKVILGWLIRDMEGLPAWGNVPPEGELLLRSEALLAKTSTASRAAEPREAAPASPGVIDGNGTADSTAPHPTGRTG